ncbi:MAG: alpha/beta hydrolase, partial [Pseudomonadota bacterium]
YGSLVGQLAAQAQPELLDGLIAFGYPVRPGVAVTPPELAAASVPPARANTAAAAASDFITPGTISKAAQAAFVAQALDADPVRVDWRMLEQWNALDPGRLRIPTLLIQGARDPLALDLEHARLFRGIDHTDKRWVVLPHGDHAAFMESSRTDFLRVIDTFTAPDRPPPPVATGE